MIDVPRFPIVVIGTLPRCGSTAYLSLLSLAFNIPAFSEPWSFGIYKKREKTNGYLKYLEYREKSKKYVVKFWINQLEQRSPYHEDMKIGYKILLQRKDIVGQIASWYIAEQTNIWSNNNNQMNKNYTVDINQNKISQIIEYVTTASFYAENCNIFDKRIYYEDIDFSSLPKIYPQKTKQPENINEIRQEIESQMKDKIPKHWRHGAVGEI